MIIQKLNLLKIKTLLALFRTNQLIANILLIVYAFLLRFPAFMQPEAWAPASSGVLSEWVYNYVGINSFGANLLAVFLVFFQAILINIMMSRHRLANETTLLPGLFYIFWVSCLPDFLHLSPLLMANTFYILLLMELFNCYKRPSAAGKIYNIGLWAGIGSLFYFSYIIFFLLGYIALSILRAFKFRERIILLMGLISAFVLSSIYSFLIDQLPWFWQHQFIDNLGFIDFIGQAEWIEYVKLGFVGLMLLMSIFSYNSYIFKKNIQQQKYISILFWGLLLAGITLLFQNEVRIEHLLILGAPISILLSFSFLSMKKPTAEAIHLLLVFACLILHFKYMWLPS